MHPLHYFYKWELNFKAEVVDVATGEVKHFVNKDTALDNAIQEVNVVLPPPRNKTRLLTSIFIHVDF